MSSHTTTAPGFPAAEPHAPAHHAPVAPEEIAIGVVIGRAPEYFDFFVYGIASVMVFPKVFFPFADPLMGTLYAFMVFPLAFLARPFGTAMSMAVQRRWGRGVKLVLALFLLGFATAGIAFVPSYQTLGTFSIVLLALFRTLQGVALGGSWDGLPSLLAMSAPPERRGWYAMLGQLGAPIGFIVAAALFLFLHLSLSSKDFLDWGWRYPFYVAFAINVVALFARLRLVITPEYTELLDARKLEPTPVREMLRTQGYNIFIGAFAALASYALFHLVTVFPLSWAKLHTTQTLEHVLFMQILGAFLAIVAMAVSGAVADKLGRRTTLGGTACLIAVYSGFTPMLLGGGSTSLSTFILVGFVLLGLSYGQAAGAVTANFASRFRYTGAALTADVAWIVGAAFAPLVALGLSTQFGLFSVSLYLLSGAACTLGALSINRMIERKD